MMEFMGEHALKRPITISSEHRAIRVDRHEHYARLWRITQVPFLRNDVHAWLYDDIDRTQCQKGICLDECLSQAGANPVADVSERFASVEKMDIQIAHVRNIAQCLMHIRVKAQQKPSQQRSHNVRTAYCARLLLRTANQQSNNA